MGQRQRGLRTFEFWCCQVYRAVHMQRTHPGPPLSCRAGAFRTSDELVNRESPPRSALASLQGPLLMRTRIFAEPTDAGLPMESSRARGATGPSPAGGSHFPMPPELAVFDGGYLGSWRWRYGDGGLDGTASALSAEMDGGFEFVIDALLLCLNAREEGQHGGQRGCAREAADMVP
ncbi:hypothetical protein NUW54_g14206 [Trametes sanguinea]|uniref:Uncharacterized protein n=1 Tax=Trametes sanguinea TaxID=158606 RepID=A0ACC1ME44_9APHY|nr:hypothetical protein NUW54_g14206 [Trametes sanguinea]